MQSPQQKEKNLDASATNASLREKRNETHNEVVADHAWLLKALAYLALILVDIWGGYHFTQVQASRGAGPQVIIIAGVVTAFTCIAIWPVLLRKRPYYLFGLCFASSLIGSLIWGMSGGTVAI